MLRSSLYSNVFLKITKMRKKEKKKKKEKIHNKKI